MACVWSMDVSGPGAIHYTCSLGRSDVKLTIDNQLSILPQPSPPPLFLQGMGSGATLLWFDLPLDCQRHIKLC